MMVLFLSAILLALLGLAFWYAWWITHRLSNLEYMARRVEEEFRLDIFRLERDAEVQQRLTADILSRQRSDDRWRLLVVEALRSLGEDLW